MEENAEGPIDLGDSIKRMDVLEATYGTQHQRGENENSSENSIVNLKQKLIDIQAKITEALKNPSMKNALKVGAMLLLVSQLARASEAISETDNRPTPDQLPSLINDFNMFLISDRANGAGATEGLNTLVELAKKSSNNPFPESIRSELTRTRRLIHINNLPIKTQEYEGYFTDLDVDATNSNPEKSPDLPVQDLPKYSGNTEIVVEDTFEPNGAMSEEIQAKLRSALEAYGPIELTLKNGNAVTIDGIKITDLKASGPGTDDRSAVGFSIEFTSTKNPFGESPISYGGFFVSVSPDGNVLRVRQQDYTFLPEKDKKFADTSVKTAAEVLNALEFRQITFAEYIPASSDGKTTYASRYSVDGDVVTPR